MFPFFEPFLMHLTSPPKVLSFMQIVDLYNPMKIRIYRFDLDGAIAILSFQL